MTFKYDFLNILLKITFSAIFQPRGYWVHYEETSTQV